MTVNPDDFIAAYDDPTLSGWTAKRAKPAGRRTGEGWRHRLDGAPLKIVMLDPCGARVVARANLATGEMIPVEPWVNDICPEDWEWFERQWAEQDAFDYRFKFEMMRSPA